MQDVLVVGGGPTGFITALGLARAGASVRLVEAEPDIVDSPRAAVYHWAVLDGLDELGLLDEASRTGLLKQDYTYLLPSTGERIDFDLRVLEGRTPHPYNVHLGQAQLTGIARDALARHANAQISFDSRLVGMEQDDAGVTARIDGPQGREEVRARWIIGADGAGSTVRKLLGLSFDGMTWPERFVATNVRYDFQAEGYGLTTMVIDASHGAVIVKLDESGLWRCTYMEDAALPEESFMDRLPAAYRHLLPGAGRYRVESAAPYKMHQRSAARYRVGRALLVGDAAHVTNPTGGLGLTSGLFDSYALHAALSAVLLERADEDVLDRYCENRREIFLNQVSPQAVRNKQLIFHANGGGTALEEALAGLRRMARDPDYRLKRLMFTKTLESPPLIDLVSAL